MVRKTKRVNWEDETKTFFTCGKGPYKFVGIEEQSVNADGLVRVPTNDGLDHWTTPGGTCAVCGTYIKVFYHFISSDGIRFHVGCECAEQADLPYEILTKVQKAKRDRAKKQRWAREEKKIKELENLVDSTDFSEYEHPNKYRSNKGENMQHYVDWMMTYSGTSGKVKLMKLLKSIKSE